MEQIPFIERVCQSIIDNASVFADTFLRYDYLVCCQAFATKYRIITANERNYLHLTGVHTSMKPDEFFNKALSGKLVPTDFDFIKPHVSEQSVKGSVREKIIALPQIDDFFAQDLYASDGFMQNRMVGTFSTADTSNLVTLGFVQNGNPMSLLKGNKLKGNNICNVDLVFQRDKNAESSLFTAIKHGNIEAISSYISVIESFLCDELRP
ncbi:MAG: hypothetical protein IJV40_03185 [Oscillospiraceae bacterium]|nr:hypothetical protein [Oscillospiraceae bacterium]